MGVAYGGKGRKGPLCDQAERPSFRTNIQFGGAGWFAVLPGQIAGAMEIFSFGGAV